MAHFDWTYHIDEDGDEFYKCDITQEILYFTGSAFKHVADVSIICEIWEIRIMDERIVKPSADKYAGSILLPSYYAIRSELGYNDLGMTDETEEFPGYQVYEIFHAWDTMTDSFENWLNYYRNGGYRNDENNPY